MHVVDFLEVELLLFNLSCNTFIEPELLRLQVVIIIHECTESERENYISEGIGFALSIPSGYTAVTLTFKHNHRDSFFPISVFETFTFTRTRLTR